jgi:hypothetical protein
MARAGSVLKQNIGYVEDHAIPYNFHGSKRSRAYESRCRVLRDSGYAAPTGRASIN